ncbi:MAG: PEP-utilizing enzyme [Actinomycetota bacterium]|jgi:phosphohistidine swiveling domain-containing protein
MTAIAPDATVLNPLLAANQRCTAELLLGRTEIQATLVPTPPYIILACLEIFERQPEVLRMIESAVDPAELGRAVRAAGHQKDRPVGGIDLLNIWALTGLYLWGREFGIGLGLWKPGDRVADVAYTLDFTRRVCQGYRDDGAFVSFEDIGGHNRCLDAATLSAFTDALEPLDDEGPAAFKRLNGTLFLYTFLDSMECRKNTFDSGPYPSPYSDDEAVIVRDYYAMGPDIYPWSRVAGGVPYHSVTLAFAVRNTEVTMTPWATPAFSPEQYLDNITRAAVFSRDSGTWAAIPLAETAAVADAVHDAHLTLYREVAGWDLPTKLLSGATFYFFEGCLSWAHEAGLGDKVDWSLSPQAAERLALLSEEVVMKLFGGLVMGYTPVDAAGPLEFTLPAAPPADVEAGAPGDHGPGAGGPADVITGSPTFRAPTVRGELVRVSSPEDVLNLLDDPERVRGLVLLVGEPGATFLSPLFDLGPAAVVCTAGTPLSHLGIVTREFNIPAVMGAPAAAALADGTAVEISTDSGAGLVKRV